MLAALVMDDGWLVKALYVVTCVSYRESHLSAARQAPRRLQRKLDRHAACGMHGTSQHDLTWATHVPRYSVLTEYLRGMSRYRIVPYMPLRTHVHTIIMYIPAHKEVLP